MLLFLYLDFFFFSRFNRSLAELMVSDKALDINIRHAWKNGWFSRLSLLPTVDLQMRESVTVLLSSSRGREGRSHMTVTSLSRCSLPPLACLQSDNSNLFSMVEPRTVVADTEMQGYIYMVAKESNIIIMYSTLHFLSFLMSFFFFFFVYKHCWCNYDAISSDTLISVFCIPNWSLIPPYPSFGLETNLKTWLWTTQGAFLL